MCEACYPTEVKEILTDLIAELRELHPVSRDICDTCTACGEYSPGYPVFYDPTTSGLYPCPTLLALDRAEARLNDVSMSLTKGHDDE